MLTFLLRVAVNAAAIALAARLIPGIVLAGPGAVLVAALVFGLVNAIVKPVLVVLTLPITLLTLGLFIFVVNAACFWLTSLLVPGFELRGFWPALFGSLFVSAVSWLLNALVGRRSTRA
jgi:putative membrane protein